MEKQIISKFKELPKTKVGWKTLIFGVCYLLSIGIMFLIYNSTNESIMFIFYGLIIITLSFIFFIFTLINFIYACKKGDKSWVAWIGFIPVILTIIFLFLDYFLSFQIP